MLCRTKNCNGLSNPSGYCDDCYGYLNRDPDPTLRQIFKTFWHWISPPTEEEYPEEDNICDRCERICDINHLDNGLCVRCQVESHFIEARK